MQLYSEQNSDNVVNNDGFEVVAFLEGTKRNL